MSVCMCVHGCMDLRVCLLLISILHFLSYLLFPSSLESDQLSFLPPSFPYPFLPFPPLPPPPTPPLTLPSNNLSNPSLSPPSPLLPLLPPPSPPLLSSPLLPLLLYFRFFLPLHLINFLFLFLIVSHHSEHGSFLWRLSRPRRTEKHR